MATRSNSLSTMSTATSSKFLDARSEFADAQSGAESQNQVSAEKETVLEKEENGQLPADGIAKSGSDEEIDGIQDTRENQNEVKDLDENENENEGKNEDEDESDSKTEDVKTEQPQPVKQPRAFVSKEEKIRQTMEQNKNRGYQREESSCHEYICSNNMVEVLDLPSVTDIFSSLCLVCCGSCCTSTTATVKTAAI